MDEKGKWKELLQHMIAVEASDLHAAPGQCVRIRRDGALVSDAFVPSASFMDALLGEMISEGRRAILPGHDVDFRGHMQAVAFAGMPTYGEWDRTGSAPPACTHHDAG